MANADTPFGLTPVGFLNGASWTGKGNVYCIPTTDSTNLYVPGDPVVLAGSSDANGVPTITLATAGNTNPVLGAILGAGGTGRGGDYGVPAEAPIVIPAVKTRNYYVLVSDDPSTLYLAQEDSIGGAIAVASVGLNVDLIAGTAGGNGYRSKWLLDSNTVNSSATYQMKLLRLWDAPDNAVGALAKWVVSINLHPFKAGIAGI